MLFHHLKARMEDQSCQIWNGGLLKIKNQSYSKPQSSFMNHPCFTIHYSPFNVVDLSDLSGGWGHPPRLGAAVGVSPTA